MKNIVYSKLQIDENQKDVNHIQQNHEDDHSQQHNNTKSLQNKQNIYNFDNISDQNGFKNAEIYSKALKNKNKNLKNKNNDNYHDSIFWLRKQKQFKQQRQQFGETYRQTLKDYCRKDRLKAEKFNELSTKKKKSKEFKIDKNNKQFQFAKSNCEYYVMKPKKQQQNAFKKAQKQNREIQNSQSRYSRCHSHSQYTKKASQKIIDQKVDNLMKILCRQASYKSKKDTLSKSRGLNSMRCKKASENKTKNLQNEFARFFTNFS